MKKLIYMAWMLMACIGMTCTAVAQTKPAEMDSAAEVRANLASLPRPWKSPDYKPLPEEENYLGGGNTCRVRWCSQDEYIQVLKAWESRYDFVSLEILGQTAEGDPLYAVRIDDRSANPEPKQRIAIVTLHAGSERSPFCAAMKTLEFLVSPAAADYRRHYEFAVMPACNPYGLFRVEGFCPWNSKKVIPYAPPEGSWDIPNLVFTKLDASPELAAFFKLIDEFQPEILMDWHGVDRAIPGEIMAEYVGGAGSNHALSPWSGRLVEAAIQGASAAGYHIPRDDEAMERLRNVTAAGKAFPRRFRESQELFYPDMYPYVKYHTMPVIFEIAHEGMALGALRGILDFGMTPPAEFEGAFPVNNVRTDFGGFSVCSGGRTPAERRASRVELWSQIEGVDSFRTYPKYQGRDTFIVTLGNRGRKEFFGNLDPNRYHNLYLSKLISGKESDDVFDWEAIQQFALLGPENQLAPLGGMPVADNGIEGVTLSNGIGFAFDIPVASVNTARLLDLRVNGHDILKRGNVWRLIRTDVGYRVSISLTAEECRNVNYFVITCAYVSDVPEESWGWMPSANTSP